MVECVCFLLALKKVVDANLEQDFELLRGRENAVMIDWGGLTKRGEEWEEYDRRRTKTAKPERIQGSAGDKRTCGSDTPIDIPSKRQRRNGEPSDVDRAHDWESASDESDDPKDPTWDIEKRNERLASILNWQHGKKSRSRYTGVAWGSSLREDDHQSLSLVVFQVGEASQIK